MVQELNFQPFHDRIPPQNVDAEEAILGGILLDPEAMSRVLDILRPEAFYLSAHQELYRAALTLQNQGSPTDLMSVTTWLQDRGLLEKVGGQSKLVELVDRTVSAVNIDQYARLVVDKYLRRKLIGVGQQISQLGHETAKDLENVLDDAEQKVFSITQIRPNQGLVSTADILTKTFSEIEQRSIGMAVPGLACGFYDLDAMTQGFQRSDLVIVAGRPSMGKCLSHDAEIVLADGSIATISEIYQRRQACLLTLGSDWRFQTTQPSAFVDDGIKPVFQVKTRLGRTVETTLTHPYLTIDGWQPLSNLKVGDRIAVPRRIDIFGSETIRACEAKLLGYLIGDGCLTKISPEFTNQNPQIQADFIEAVTQFGNLKVPREDSSGQRTPSFRVSTDSEILKTHRQVFGAYLRELTQQQKLSDRDLAVRLGVSDSLIGCWKKGTSGPSPEALQRLEQILQVRFEETFAPGTAAICSENALTQWLKSLSLWGKNAHEKTVPDMIFRLERSQIALFLNRLFATDGWATVLASGQSQLGYATVSQRLAQQIQHLLLRFGIIASLKPRLVKYNQTRRPCWQLDITDSRSIQTFISEIGIFGKEDATERVLTALATRRYQTNRDLVPVAVWQHLDTARGERSWAGVARQAGILSPSNIHAGQRALTQGRLLALATALQNESLQNLATGDVYWDEIVSIAFTGDKQVYDLTIPETHNFVANDICVHNTAFSLGLASNIAIQHKLPVAIFSLEMSKEQIIQRLLSKESRIESNRLRSGRISHKEWEPLGHAISRLSEIRVFVDDTPNISLNEMRSRSRRLQAEQGGVLGLILIDYLQLMEGSGSENRVQELARITRSLKALARELNVPIIALSQLSRSVEARADKRPMMSDLRESGSIEQDADLIMMLYRDDYYNPDSPDRGLAEVNIVKHRNGPTGCVKLLFEPQFTEFRNLASPNRT
ncbi:replicative DNA helicase [Phormidesmis priestleyi]